jgi:ergothioneine biosynthesis protein EgtB
MAETPSDIATELVAWHRDARRRTLELVAALDDRQLMGPRLAIVNPMRWEVGHVAWFQEFWALRRARGESPIRADADSLYDSIKVAHDTRWDLPLPSMADTLAYAEAVLDRVLARLGSREPTAEEIYFHRLAVFHEDMHGEAFAYTRQTLGYPRPELGAARGATVANPGVAKGDAESPGGRFLLGAGEALPFVFDNEKWGHAVDLRPFRIARAPVTNAEFAEFVAAGGYRQRRFWSEEGWSWREATSTAHPTYWRELGDGRWQRRAFDRWVPLELEHPVIHVSWHEAEAYCRWRGRRLPSEAEWEMAAAFDGATSGRHRRLYPWGDEPPSPETANLDGRQLGPIAVGALPAGDSACGCRQLLGNVWEWTASDFLPYPGFVADPYKEYSEPWFGTHKVLRGGSWVTPGRLLRNTWRNFYTADRRDVFAGFRTCAER